MMNHIVYNKSTRVHPGALVEFIDSSTFLIGHLCWANNILNDSIFLFYHNPFLYFIFGKGVPKNFFLNLLSMI